MEWYDGGTVGHELAEELRLALESLRLQSTASASDYVNKFKLYTNQLSAILGKSMPTSALILLLLQNIKDNSYKNLIKQLHYNNAGLDECINQIQRKEREIIQVQREARQLKNRPQKVQATPMNNLGKFHKTSKGYISVDPKEYVKLSDEEKEAIQEYNVKLRETLKRKATNTHSAPDKKEKLTTYYQTCLMYSGQLKVKEEKDLL